MKMKRYALVFTMVILILALTMTDFAGMTAKAGASERPKLVLVLISDGFRADYLDRFGDLFGEGGLKRLMTQGAWFGNAEYDHSTTYTAVGHSAILSGSSPDQSGVVANDWYDRKTDSRVYCCEDPSVKFYADGKQIKKHKGASPRNFKGTTVGDQLLLSNNFKSKVISISVKDRGAIFTGGTIGKAFWYSSSSGRYVTSQYYYKKNPKWLDEFNRMKLADAYFGKEWELLRPVSDYARQARDDRKYETNYKGLGRTFPHPMTGGEEKMGKGFFSMLRFTPFGDKITLELVKKSITGEQLGQRGVTDLLSVSFSSVDYVGHLFGPYSVETQDNLLRLDRTVADLFNFLDKKVGMKNVVVAFTADHAMCPIPEYMAELGVTDTGRINPMDMAEAIDGALDKAFAPDDWVKVWWNPNVYLNLETIGKHKLSRTEVEDVAARFLLTFPGVANTFTRTQLMTGAVTATEQGRKMTRAFNVERSGDVFVVQKPYWYLFGPPLTYGTTHGSPYDYDSRVPLIFMGSGVKAARYFQKASVYDIAPTLAMIMSVMPPSLSQGRVLHEALQ
jgi:predicted AlkP superfamily pyrophosphatase or phosphodiesterase